MKRAAVFFDRDNTLLVSDGYLGDPDKVVLMEGAPEAVAKARQLGFVVVTVSNQSGVARGMFSEDAVHEVNKKMDALLQQAKPAAVIARHEFCPFHPQGTVERYCQDSYLRKPKPGMILQAADKLNLDLSRSWLIGDTPRDIEAGRAAGVRTVLFKHPSHPASPDADAASDAKPDFEATSLAEAMEIVGREAFKRIATSGATASVTTSAITASIPRPNPEASANPPTGPAKTVIEIDEKDDLAPEEASAIAETARVITPVASPVAAPVAGPVAAPVPAAPEPSPPPAQAPIPEGASMTSAIPPQPQSSPPSPAIAPAAPSPMPAIASTPADNPSPAPEPAPRPAAPAQHSPASRIPPELVAHIETLLEQVLVEMRRGREQPDADFSIPKLLAGIVQIVALGMLLVAYINRDNAMSLPLIGFAIYFQILTITLLVMGRQK